MWEHIALLPGDEAPPWTPHDAARWATALLFSLRHQRATGEDRQLRDCPRLVIVSACGLASARVLMQGENAGDRPDTAAAVAAIATKRVHALTLGDVRRDLPRIDQAAVANRGFHYDSQDRRSFSQRCSRAFIDDLLYLKACLQMEYIDENRERTRYVATPIVCGRAMDRAIITAARARDAYITRASLTGWDVEERVIKPINRLIIAEDGGTRIPDIAFARNIYLLLRQEWDKTAVIKETVKGLRERRGSDRAALTEGAIKSALRARGYLAHSLATLSTPRSGERYDAPWVAIDEVHMFAQPPMRRHVCRLNLVKWGPPEVEIRGLGAIAIRQDRAIYFMDTGHTGDSMAGKAWERSPIGSCDPRWGAVLARRGPGHFIFVHETERGAGWGSEVRQEDGPGPPEMDSLAYAEEELDPDWTVAHQEFVAMEWNPPSPPRATTPDNELRAAGAEPVVP